MSVITASVARQTLPAQLDRVERGEEVEITRHGHVVAVLVSPEALSRHRAAVAWRDADRLSAMLERARSAPLPEPTIPAERADELVEAMRAGRRAE